jgi:hypothetical protein
MFGAFCVVVDVVGEEQKGQKTGAWEDVEPSFMPLFPAFDATPNVSFSFFYEDSDSFLC